MRAAIYARYSSDLQSAASIEDQVRLCRERIERDGGQVVEVYADYAVSGGSLHNRTGMQSLLRDARAGRFDHAVAEALDRISRDQEDIAGIFKRLQHAGIVLLTLSEGAISELHVGLKGTMNALFLKDLAAKTRRGQRGRVEAGRIPGGNSYGYRMVRRLLADGSVTTGERAIEPAEAAIVQRIFQEYAAGLSPRQIATRLNRERVPDPRGGDWNASTINGSRQRRNGILNNELYLGRITYNRQRFIKDPDTGRRVSRVNPESEWVTKDVPALRIVEDALWDRTVAIRQRHSSRAGNKRQTTRRLLSGLLRCGRCGGGMTLARGDRYYCSARREKGICDANRGIAAGEIEGRVLTGLRDILLGREDMLDAFVASFRAELELLRRTRRQSQQTLSREMQEVERGIARCLDYITSGDGDPGLVRDRLRTLEGRKRALDAAMRAPDTDPTVDLHPNLPALYRRKVEALSALLAEEDARPQAMDAIRALIERIEVHPGLARGQCGVTLAGALAGILSFCTQTPNAALIGGGVSGTSFMVAGARNSLDLLLRCRIQKL